MTVQRIDNMDLGQLIQLKYGHLINRVLDQLLDRMPFKQLLSYE